MPLRIGTRGSDLALVQARQVAELLGASGRTTEIVVIETSGDRGMKAGEVGTGKALWTKEIEEHLLAGSIDLAVHSLKDLPADLPEGLALGTVLTREDPRDALVTSQRPLAVDELPPGARIGTGSGRRRAALEAIRQDLRIDTLKGNVETRLRRLTLGDFDAIVLALAGLRRLGLTPAGLHPLDPDVVPPALGQGIVAVEVRESDARADWLDALTHRDSLLAARAERSLLRTLEVGCGAPVGGLATVDRGTLSLFGALMSPDGARCFRHAERGSADGAEEVGIAVARGLLAAAGEAFMEGLRSAPESGT